MMHYSKSAKHQESPVTELDSTVKRSPFNLLNSTLQKHKSKMQLDQGL